MIKNIKGTKDLLPNSTYDLQDIENHLMRFLHIHGYGEIRTPIFETQSYFLEVLVKIQILLIKKCIHGKIKMAKA